MKTIPIEDMPAARLRVELISAIRAGKLVNRRIAELEAQLQKAKDLIHHADNKHAELQAEIERLNKVLHDKLITDCKGCPYDDACKSWTARIAELEAECRQRGALEIDATAVIFELRDDLALLQWRSVEDGLPEKNDKRYRHSKDVIVEYLGDWYKARYDYEISSWTIYNHRQPASEYQEAITHWMPIPPLPEPKEHDCKYNRIEMAGKTPMVMCGCKKKDWQEGVVCGESSYKNCRYGEPKENSNG